MSDDALASIKRIHRQVRHLIWITGFNIALLLVVYWQLCTIARRLP